MIIINNIFLKKTLLKARNVECCLFFGEKYIVYFRNARMIWKIFRENN